MQEFLYDHVIGDDDVKKSISILLSFLTLVSVFSIYITTIAQEKQQNNVISVSEEVSELVQQYDTTLLNEEENSDNGITREVKTSRLIVKTKEQIDLFDAIDCVKGLGFYFVQFEDYDSAKAAYDSYKSKGYIVEFDSIIKKNFDEVSSSEETDDTMWAYERVGVDKALEYLSSKNLNDVTVAVLDTGVDYTHELFSNRIIKTNLNFSNSGNENDCMDTDGHGTNVAGIVALSTPNTVTIEPYRIGEDNGDLLFSSMIFAYEYILNSNNKPDILNMSYGTSTLFGYELYSDYYEELYNSGIIMVSAAGNANTLAQQNAPACFDSVLAVASSDINNKKSSFSNFGNAVNVAAPGENVYTAQLGGGYTTDFSGTSASTPLTAGAAAVLLSVDNRLTNEGVYERIEKTATDVQVKGYSDWCGSGIINYEKLTGQSVTEGSVSFNIDEGDYYDAPLHIELSTTNSNAIIKYSTDLTIPNNENGFIYSEPILVDEHATILATVIEPNKSAGEYVLNEYNVIYHADENDFDITEAGTISAYNGSHNSIVIPDEINSIAPINLGDELFKDNQSIISVQLPDCIKIIGRYTFANSSIQEIKGNKVMKIETRAFYGAEHLYKESLPNVSTVNLHGFDGCINLTQQLSFENSLTSIGSYAFALVPIEVINLPNYTDDVYKCFGGCNAREIYLPKTTCLQQAFYGCGNLTKVYAPKVTELEDDVFYDCTSLYEFDFSNIEVIYERGLCGSYFDEINLIKCNKLEKNAFRDCKASKISLPNVTVIPEHCFYQCRYLEELEIPNVEHFNNESIIFSNIYCLKQLIIPKADNFPIIHIYAYDDGPWWTEPLQDLELEVIYAPKVTEIPNMTTSEHDAEDNVTSRPLSEILNNVKWAFLPSLTNDRNLPWSEGMTLYLSDSFNYLENNSQHTELNFTIIAPLASNAETWSMKNDYAFIAANSMANAFGGSIRLFDSGLRFGFSWNNIEELESIADSVEYGFVYSYEETDDLTIENGRKKVANKRIDHDGYTTFNLVFTNIPKANYDTKISARAYVCIDGMYFYSDIITRSFKGVANAVLADDTIDAATKEQVRNILEA